MGSRQGAQAYKLDEPPEWFHWAEMVDLTMSNLIGPEAPHYFRICLRSQLGFGALRVMGSQRSAHATQLRTGATNLDQMMS